MRTQNKKGFTLAELLIVVAILGVLMAIAIPVFTGSLEKAKLAVDNANFRSAQSIAALLKQQGEITIAGHTYTLSELSAENKLLYMQKDGSFLIADFADAPPNTYLAQADDPNSQTHKKGRCIAIMVQGGQIGHVKIDVAWFATTL